MYRNEDPAFFFCRNLKKSGDIYFSNVNTHASAGLDVTAEVFAPTVLAKEDQLHQLRYLNLQKSALVFTPVTIQ